MEKEKSYARHCLVGMDSGSKEYNLFHHRRFNPGLSPCLLYDLSPCTAETCADNIQIKIHTNTFVQQNLLAQSGSQDWMHSRRFINYHCFHHYGFQLESDICPKILHFILVYSPWKLQILNTSTLHSYNHVWQSTTCTVEHNTIFF
jgi:hypothetical protein